MASASHVDSLSILINKHQIEKNWAAYFQHSVELGNYYKIDEKYELGRSLIEELLAHPEASNHPKQGAKALQLLGECYKRQNLFDKAMEVYDQLKNLDLGDNEKFKAIAFSEMASIQQALGNYEKAYEIQMEALNIRKINGDTIGIARSEYRLGTIFYYQKQFPQALEFYEKAYKTFSLAKQKRQIYSCLAAIGSTYESLAENSSSSEKEGEKYVEKAKEYNEQSLALAQSMNYKTGIAYSLGNLSGYHLNKKDFVAAERLQRESLKLKTDLGDIWGVIGSSLNLADIHIKWGRPKEALPLLEGALIKADRLETKPRKLQAFKLYTDAYEMLNDRANAFKYLKKFTALQDSVLNEKTVEEMGQSKRRFEFQLKEHEIKMLKQSNQLLGKDKKIQKLQTYGAILVSIMLFLIGIWFWNRYKVQGRMNDLLAEKNSLLNSKNEEIFVKNKLLELSNQDLSQFAYVASHDLKEPLRMIHSYTNLLEKRYKHAFDESGLEFMHFITDAVSRMKTLLDDLLDFSRAGKSDKESEMIDLNDIMTMVEANLRHRFLSLNASIEINNMPVVKSHRSQLMQLLQNLVSNGVKFNRPGVDPVVKVDCHRKDDFFIISIEDNGIGIAEEYQAKVFEMFRRLHTKDEYEGTGIGLATCKRIVTGMGGDIWLESTVGEGTTFFISLPCPAEELVMA